MNSENSKIFDSHRLFINISDKIELKRSHIYVALQSPCRYYICKNI